MHYKASIKVNDMLKTFLFSLFFLFLTLANPRLHTRLCDVILPNNCPSNNLPSTKLPSQTKHSSTITAAIIPKNEKCGSSNDENDIYITVLVPFSDLASFSLSKLRPSITSIRTLFATHLPCRRIEITYRNSFCSDKYSMHQAVKGIIGGRVSVFVGPICDFAVAPVAREVEFWKIPIISIGAIAHDLADRSVNYRTLTRAGSINLPSLLDVFKNFMEKYSWKKAFFLYERSGFNHVYPSFCHFVAEHIALHWLQTANKKRNNKKSDHNKSKNKNHVKPRHNAINSNNKKNKRNTNKAYIFAEKNKNSNKYNGTNKTDEMKEEGTDYGEYSYEDYEYFNPRTKTAKSGKSGNVDFLMEYYKVNELNNPRTEIHYVLTKKLGKDFAVVLMCLSPSFLKSMMEMAVEMGFDNGEYVFVNIDPFSRKERFSHQLKNTFLQNDEANAEEADKSERKFKKLNRSFFVITLPSHTYSSSHSTEHNTTISSTNNNNNENYYGKKNYDKNMENINKNIDSNIKELKGFLDGGAKNRDKISKHSGGSNGLNKVGEGTYGGGIHGRNRGQMEVNKDSSMNSKKINGAFNSSAVLNEDDHEVNDFRSDFYDALILYVLALNETISEGFNAKDGLKVIEKMKGKVFMGSRGLVSMDSNGDKCVDYTLMGFNEARQRFEEIGKYNGREKRYTEGERVVLFGGRGTPSDTPRCGYKGCKVADWVYIVLFTSLWASTVFCVFIIVLFYRRYRFEAELEESKWKVRWQDVVVSGKEQKNLDRMGSRMSLSRRGSYHSGISDDTIAFHSNNALKQVYIKTASYKSTIVAIKEVSQSLVITKPLLLLIKKMRNLQNDHVARFIGVCMDGPAYCILMEYAQKGSLMDVLENDQIKLDNMFKFSLIQDIIRGMHYIHNSELKTHGNLKSSNCIVDSRFVLKITDYAFISFKGKVDEVEDLHAHYKAKLWTSPELLKSKSTPPQGTQKGDVYSFCIVCQEIIYRKGTFWVEGCYYTPQEIVELVKNESKPPFRPTIFENEDNNMNSLLNLLKKCWADDPGERYDFGTIKSIVKRINKNADSGGNLLDNLLLRMEQYANNLETLVEERTSDYIEEKKKAENLLYTMLPRSVATQLMRGGVVEAEKFDSVTIYFSDICGFTALSAQSTPMQVIDLLNDLYTTFDHIIDLFDVYKVETIGDAYMVVSGLPKPNGTTHAGEIARMALSLLKKVKTFKIRHQPTAQLNLRIGIHSGAVCAGVVGTKMPRYCLFGDTVNTASRMESNGLPLKIHVSPSTRDLLEPFGTFTLQLRGPVFMKGKGDIETWWLLSENNPRYPHLSE